MKIHFSIEGALFREYIFHTFDLYSVLVQKLSQLFLVSLQSRILFETPTVFQVFIQKPFFQDHFRQNPQLGKPTVISLVLVHTNRSISFRSILVLPHDVFLDLLSRPSFKFPEQESSCNSHFPLAFKSLSHQIPLT